MGVEPQRGGQHGQLRGAQCAYRDQGAVGCEPGAHRAHLGDASLELLGQQPDDEEQGVVDQQHSALDPAYRAREPDRVAAQRIGRCAAARGPLGMRHHRFERIEFTGHRAARQSGSRLKVVWLSGQYQRAICVPRGVLRA